MKSKAVLGLLLVAGFLVSMSFPVAAGECEEWCADDLSDCFSAMAAYCPPMCIEAVYQQIENEFPGVFPPTFCASFPEYCQFLYNQCEMPCEASWTEACTNGYNYCMEQCNE